MFDIRAGRVRPKIFSGTENGVTILFLAICFLIGSVAGCIVGGLSQADDLRSTLNSYLDINRDIIGFFSALWACSKYHLLVLFLAGSVTGVFILPLLCVFRGYLLGCTAASLSAFAGGWLVSLVVVGLPAIFTLPSFFLLCEDGLHLSRRLLILSTGGSNVRKPVDFSRHCIVSGALLSAAALIQLFIIPEIVIRLL